MDLFLQAFITPKEGGVYYKRMSPTSMVGLKSSSLNMKKKIITTLIVLLVLVAVGGASAYFAFSGGGQIDVSAEITNTNQDGFANKVRPDTRSTLPNGGLNPQGGQSTAPPPPPEPIPVEAASTTHASSTAASPTSTTERR